MGRILKTLCLVLAVVLVLGLAQQRKLRGNSSARELIRQAEELEASVAALGPEEMTHQRNLARWYNYNLELGTDGLEEAYETILNFGGGRMAVLGVPEWELRMPIYHSGGGGINHDPATSMPIGGRGTHAVLHLNQSFPWTEGISLYIDCLGQRLTYRVVSVQVEDGKTEPERPGEKGEDLLTLVFDQEETRTQIRCERSGELVIRQEESGAHFPWAAPAAAFPVLLLVWIWRGKGPAKAVRNGRIYGFCRKNIGKTKLF